MRSRSIRIAWLALALGFMPAATASAQSSPEAEFKAQFLKLCDLACEQINNPDRQKPKPVPFYHDSYAVRALCVAYDMTAKDAYLRTCQDWSDRMVEFQKSMTPKGAYYMNYQRKPGDKEGPWYVADSSSIAMGVLATAVRSTGAEKEKYLGSVKQFAEYVARNCIGEAGGVMNGLWPKYCGEWWCSSGIFGSLAFLLADETGDQRYREIGVGAVNWLNHLDWSKTKFEYWRTGEPTVVMYCLEAYSAGMPYVRPSGKTHEDTLDKLEWAMQWTVANQKSQTASAPWDYSAQWGSKLGGLPFHMYVLSREAEDPERLLKAADAELQFIAGQLEKPQQPVLSQLACFAMMSYAERLSPGTIYRNSRMKPGASDR